MTNHKWNKNVREPVEKPSINTQKCKEMEEWGNSSDILTYNLKVKYSINYLLGIARSLVRIYIPILFQTPLHYTALISTPINPEVVAYLLYLIRFQLCSSFVIFVRVIANSYLVSIRFDCLHWSVSKPFTVKLLTFEKLSLKDVFKLITLQQYRIKLGYIFQRQFFEGLKKFMSYV